MCLLGFAWNSCGMSDLSYHTTHWFLAFSDSRLVTKVFWRLSNHNGSVLGLLGLLDKFILIGFAFFSLAASSASGDANTGSQQTEVTSLWGSVQNVFAWHKRSTFRLTKQEGFLKDILGNMAEWRQSKSCLRRPKGSSPISTSSASMRVLLDLKCKG